MIRPAAAVGFAAALAFVAQLPAQDAKKQSPKPAARTPNYPRVNLAPSYEVDPNWPQRPAGVGRGHVPGVAVDAHDNVWVFTRAVPPVQVYTPDGKYIKGWGADTVGKAHHIRFDKDGNVWLADIGHHVVRKFSPDGKILLTLGTPDEPGEDERRLNLPTDMAVTPAGDVFVSDGYGNNRVVHFDRTGKFVKTWGKMGTGPGELSLPHSIALDSKGHLYVAERNNVRVQVFDQSGKTLDTWANVMVPWGLWVTPADEVWVCGSSPMTWPADPAGSIGCPPKDQMFVRFDTTGRARQVWVVPKGETGKEKPGDLNWVHAMAVDSKGNIYAGDIYGQRVQKFVLKK